MHMQRLLPLAVLFAAINSPVLSAENASSCGRNPGDGSEANPLCFKEGPNVGAAAWKKAMKADGAALKRHKVRQMLLVHGTFVGDDPFGFYNILENLVKGSGDSNHSNLINVIDAIKQAGKLNLINLVAGDVGNYTKGYAAKYCGALGNGICDAEDVFIWGSGNYHLARLEGALKLSQVLADRIQAKHILPDERVLLMGHSHAGQVFALLTTLLEGGKTAQELIQFVAEDQNLGEKSKQELLDNLSTIKTVNLDIVTYGTPVRYAWGRYEKFRLLALVNHRPDPDRTNRLDLNGLLGVLSVRDGDYVQQWGVEGSDTPLLVDWDAVAKGKRLDTILNNLGQNLPAFIDNLKTNTIRKPHYENGELAGTTVFVDYRDNAAMPLPDVATGAYTASKVFGHGAYTTEEAILFNTDIIVKRWYSP